MNLQDMPAIMLHANKDDENNLEVLKRELKVNGFKLCFVSADMMLTEMEEGLGEEATLYWKTLAAKLPYAPFDALTEEELPKPNVEIEV